MRDRKLDRLYDRYRAVGDVTALGELFDQVAPELLRLARHLSGRASGAEDLVQSTFVTAIERSRGFDQKRAVVPWLVGILARHAANARRKSDRMLDVERVEAGSSQSLARDASVVAEERELRQRLDGAVGELPEAYREVLVPFLIEGKRPREIASQLGLSQGAARVRVHRGLEMLRRALPAGFAAGGAVSISSGRSLGAVRAQVMAAAQHAGTPLTAGATGGISTSTWIGGLLMSQRILIAGCALVVAVASFLWLRRDSDSVARKALVSPPTAQVARASPSPVADESKLLGNPSSREEVRAAADEGGARFLGRVLDYVSGAPIRGARAWTTPQGEAVQVLRTESDAEGKLEFRAPPTERDTLRVEAAGYAPTIVPLTPERREEFWKSCGYAASNAGRDLALYEIRLVPGLEFAGRVVDPGGTPVEGAELVLCCFEHLQLQPIEDRAIGRTDAEGRMVFDGLVPRLVGHDAAHYVLFAVHADGIGWTRIPNASERERVDAIEIVLDPGLRLEVSLRLDDESPLSGARVSCVPGHAPFSHLYLPGWGQRIVAFHPVLAEAMSAETDADGRAVVPHLLRRLESPDTGFPCLYLVDVELDGKCIWRDDREFPCEATAVLELSLAREPSWAITGRIADESGAPVAGALVEMRELGRTATSGPDGSYTLRMLPDDPLVIFLRASHAGFSEAPAKLDRTVWTFRFDGHDFVLRRPLTIEGRVIDDGGDGAAGVLVRGLGPEGRMADTPPERPTDERGRFVLEGASAGQWELFVYPPADRFASTLGKRWLAQGGDRGVEIVLERQTQAKCGLEVEVVDQQSGRPIDVLQATLFSVGLESLWNRSTVRWSGGRVSVDDLEVGRYDVWVAVAGRPSGFATVEVDPSRSPNRARIEIGRPARVFGRVDCSRIERPSRLDVMGSIDTATGAFPGGAEFQQGAVPYAMATAAEDGTFELENLMPGPWRFDLRGEGVRTAKPVYQVDSGESVEVLLVAEPAAVIEFVLDASPAGAWMIAQVARDGGQWRNANNFWPGKSEPPPPMPLTVEPGKLRWRVLFSKVPNAHRPELVCETREGELELAPGERRIVPLSVVAIEK